MVWQPVVGLLRLVRMWRRWVSTKEVGEAFCPLLVDAQPSFSELGPDQPQLVCLSNFSCNRGKVC